MNATSQYIALLTALVVDKNALGEKELLSLLNAGSPLNIFDNCDVRLTSEDKFAFRQAFEKIPFEIDWPVVQLAATALIARVREGEKNRWIAWHNTKLLWLPAQTNLPAAGALTLGILWCGEFTRPGLNARLFSPNRRYFYHAPSLFLETMRDWGHHLAYLRFDEDLTLGDLDGTQRKLHETADILYISSHGSFAGNGYSAMLHKSDWHIDLTRIGMQKPTVAVFDTCHLIDPSVNWRSLWARAIGPSIRLLLGFEGRAAIDRGSAMRGRAFAEHLVNGQTFVDAWLRAVKSTTASPFNKAVAIGIGDNQADANAMLAATINNFPGPRSSQTAVFEVRK